ncbi:Nitroreductase [Variovorax sp. HW608]|uniref:nitroreductase n=1 Tax=Variovorax sp. HW608 TaxID=1034889 RepID=UPI00081FCFE9|nr:nitroreductase [Variovorax sp. HW608]SCK17098.1 Nitroreductase [Variovorax sp. HW608]
MTTKDMHSLRADTPVAVQGWSSLADGRCSTRRFTDRPVPDEWIPQMLKEARRAPSGANLQPGEFIRIEGAARQRLSDRLVETYRGGAPQNEDYSYFPVPMPMTLRRRQVAAAQALYGALGAERDDQEARRAQFERNFRFFDAPVALVITIDARMGSGCYMDLGMCLYGFMLAAAARGLGSCAIGALASYPHVVRDVLGLDIGQSIVCGLSIGYADPSAPENKVRTVRRDVSEFLRVVR